jgi:hypothetical protein
MKIYLDTMLWNELCDQSVDPQTLMASLSARDAALVLGTHNFYELAKTFGPSTESATMRGQELFSYLRRFMEAKVFCAKDNMELLAEEMWALQLRQPTRALLDDKDLASIGEKVNVLARGAFDENDKDFLAAQADFAANTRLAQIQHFQTRPGMKTMLKAIAPEKLERWMRKEAFGYRGIAALTGHIQRRFPPIPQEEAIEYAVELFGSPIGRFAKGMVFADFYYNWRCANRESNPKDLLDDMQHVLNSVYCDVYATKEVKQLEYAKLLLRSSTTVAIYDGATPIDRWLDELASTASSSAPR